MRGNAPAPTLSPWTAQTAFPTLYGVPQRRTEAPARGGARGRYTVAPPGATPASTRPQRPALSPGMVRALCRRWAARVPWSTRGSRRDHRTAQGLPPGHAHADPFRGENLAHAGAHGCRTLPRLRGRHPAGG